MAFTNWPPGGVDHPASVAEREVRDRRVVLGRFISEDRFVPLADQRALCRAATLTARQLEPFAVGRRQRPRGRSWLNREGNAGRIGLWLGRSSFDETRQSAELQMVLQKTIANFVVQSPEPRVRRARTAWSAARLSRRASRLAFQGNPQAPEFLSFCRAMLDSRRATLRDTCRVHGRSIRAAILRNRPQFDANFNH